MPPPLKTFWAGWRAEQALRSVPAAAVQEERAGGTGLYFETAFSSVRAWSIWSYA
jgi:hypothetical protein